MTGSTEPTAATRRDCAQSNVHAAHWWKFDGEMVLCGGVEPSSAATVLREIERLVVSQGHRNPAATLDAVESLAVGYRLAVARTEDDNQARDEDRPILGGECECGWPKQPCLRKVLGNGPPFPPEPCEPKVTPNA